MGSRRSKRQRPDSIRAILCSNDEIDFVRVDKEDLTSESADDTLEGIQEEGNRDQSHQVEVNGKATEHHQPNRQQQLQS